MQRSEAKRSETGANTKFIYIRPEVGPVNLPVDRCAQSWAGRPPGRSVCTKRAQGSSIDGLVDRSRITIDRPIDRSRITVDRSVDRLTWRTLSWTQPTSWTRSTDRLTGCLGSVDRPTGVSGRGSVSSFRIQTLILNWRRIQLGFPKFLHLFDYK